MRTPVKVLTVAATVAIAVVTSGAAANAGADTDRPTHIAWGSCPEAPDNPAVECGTLPVPVDWARPAGERIDLALARIPASDPAARIGSLVVHPGGPGGSGVDMMLELANQQDMLPAALHRRFDVVSFDPRGVARSHSVVCSAGLLAQRPYPFPATKAEFDHLVAYNQRLRADCRRHTGPLFEHTDTLSVAHDLDSIRAALGDRRLTFYGWSYATVMGQQYAEAYPHRVRAVVVDSNVDHSVDTRRYLDQRATGVQEAFDEFVAWCYRDTDCALHGRDVRAYWHDLLARAARGELRDPADPSVVLRPSDAITFAKGVLYGPEWELLADTMVLVGEGGGQATQSRQEPELAADRVGLFCNDFSLPVRGYREYTAHIERTSRFSPDVLWAHSTLFTDCLGYPARIPNPQHRLRVVGVETPVLVVNSRYDPAAGYDDATSVAEQLGPAGVLLTYDGWGHGVFPGRSGCVDAIVIRYLVEGTAPARDIHCPAVEPSNDQQVVPVAGGVRSNRYAWTASSMQPSWG